MGLEFRHKPGMVAYLTTGDPDVETSLKIAIAAIDAGADVIELGVPFSDPLADGPVIQRASERAVARHTRMADVLRVTKGIRAARADAEALVSRIRRWSKLPVAVGFGISNAEHVARVGEFADAAVVGSAIVELIERSAPEAAPEAVARFIKGLRLPQPVLTQ